MRVAILAPYVPYVGITHAGGAYLLAHVNVLLAAGHEVRLLAPRTPVNGTVTGPRGLDVHLIPIKRSSAPGIAFLKFRNVVAGLTPGAEVLAAFIAEPLTIAVTAAADVVELQWTYMLPLLPFVRQHASHVPVVCITHDLAGDVFASTANHAPTRTVRLRHRLAMHRVARQERDLCQACDLVLVMSARDERTLRSQGVTTRVRVTDPLLSLPQKAVGPGTGSLLFTGSMSRSENHEGVRWFLERVWPALSTRCPGATLTVAGSAPPRWLLEVASERIRVTGFVEDLRATYVGADVFLAPIFVGAGLKFKVVEAMAAGLPVVATREAVAGLEDAPRQALRCRSEDPSVWLDDLTLLLQDSHLRRAAGQSGDAWARNRFNLERGARQLVEGYAELARRNR